MWDSQPVGTAMASGMQSTESLTFSKTQELKNLLFDIANKLHPVMKSPVPTSNKMEKMGSEVPLHKELDELISIALSIKNDIAL